MAGEAGTLIIRIIGDESGAVGSMGRAKGAVGTFGATAGKTSKGGLTMLTKGLGKLAKIGAVAAVAVGAAATKMAGDFDESMRKVWSLTRESEATFNTWKKSILDLSKDLPQSATEMGDALYWAKSNMPDATDAEQMETLRIAAMGAVGGIAELGDVVTALTQVQNAYQEQDPTKYMDILAKSVERGSITLQDFVGNQGKAVGTAAMAGVSFEQLAAAVATLTKAAVPVDTAFMALNQTMMSFLKPTDDAMKTAAKYGIELSLATLRSKGLAGAMMEIAESVPEEELANLFPNIRALKAAMPLTGVAAETFAEDLRQIGDASGTMANQFEKNSKSISNIWKKAWGKFKNGLIEFGEKLLPKVASAMEAMGRAFAGENKTFNNFISALKKIGTVFYDLGKAVVAVKPLLYGLAAAFVAVKVAGLAAAMAGGAGGLAGGLGLMGRGLTGLISKSFMASLALSNIATKLAAVSAGTIGLVAALVVGGGALIYSHYKASQAALEQMKSLIALDKEQGKAAQSARPLIAQMSVLKSKLATLTPDTQEYVDVKRQLLDVQGQLISIYPGLIEQIETEGGVLNLSTKDLKDYVDMKMNLGKLDVKEKAVTGLAVEWEQAHSAAQKLKPDLLSYDKTLRDIVTSLTDYGMSSRDAEAVQDAFSISVEKGNEALAGAKQQTMSATETQTEWEKAMGSSGYTTATTKANVAALDEQIGQLGATEEKWVREGYENAQAAKLAWFDYFKGYTLMVDEMRASAKRAGEEQAALPAEVISAIGATDIYLQQQGGQSAQMYMEAFFGKVWTGTPEALSQWAQSLRGQLTGGQFQAAWDNAGIEGGHDFVIGWVNAMATEQAQILLMTEDTGDVAVQGLMSALQSGVPEIAAAAAAQVHPVIAYWVEQDWPGYGMTAANQLAHGIATGEIVETADRTANEAMVAMAEKLGMTSLLSPALAAIRQEMIDADLMPEDVEEKITIEADVTGEAAEKLKEIEETANDVDGMDPTIDLKGNLEERAKNARNAVRKLKLIMDELKDKTVVIRVVKIETELSPKKTWTSAKAAGGYISEQISKGFKAMEMVGRISMQYYGSGPFNTAMQLAQYINATLSKTLMTQSIVVDIAAPGEGVGGLDLGPLVDDVENFTRALEEAQVIFGAMGEGGLLWEEMVKPFKEIEDAIMKITGGSWEHLEKWRELRGALDAANAEMDKYAKAIEMANKNIEQMSHEQKQVQSGLDGWTDSSGKVRRSIEAINESSAKVQKAIAAINVKIQASNEQISKVTSGTEGWSDAAGKVHKSLSELSQMKLAGETAADEKSFQLQQKISETKLAMLEAERAGDMDALYRLSLKQEELEDEKELHDLRMETTYPEQRRQIEKLLDPLHGQEMTQKQIVREIKKAQAEVARQEAGQRKLNVEVAKQEAIQKKFNDELKISENEHRRIGDLIAREQQKVWELKVEFDNAQVHVRAFQQTVDQMAQHFLSRLQDILSAEAELARAHEALARAIGTGDPAQIAVAQEVINAAIRRLQDIRAPGYDEGGPTPSGIIRTEVGEWVVTKEGVNLAGPDFLRNLNLGRLPEARTPMVTTTGGGDTITQHINANLPGVRDVSDFMRELDILAHRGDLRSRVGSERRKT